MFIRPSAGRLTSPFGMRTHPVTGKPTTMHWGVDFGRDAGTRIVAAADGKVTYAKSTNGYGNTVMIEHVIAGKLYTTVYAHLASFNVRVGQYVKAGATIAVMGTTGVSTGVHLHFEVHTGAWNNRFTNAVDPMLYIVDPAVKALQALLVAAGYAVKVDGIAGPATAEAIKAFQRAVGLAVDGVAGAKTLAALKRAKQAQGNAGTTQKEADYLAEKLPATQQADMRKLLQRAFDEKVFSVNHTAKVSTMTRGEALDLLISYNARKK
ncbi:peptidoglycan DD-metalloendopeptidase family protein [Sporosarcina sp. SAFN-015]|uniref:peptidoglycan DD-metalloendopeptidase family protein n=1 Tax=Sporosarcina sp. SAFN-015 TaxID=3387274 RepID=UPI003F7D3F5E